MLRNQWQLNYYNDTEPTDENFTEWWEVSNGKKTFRSAVEADAEWLCDYLNARYAPLRLPDE